MPSGPPVVGTFIPVSREIKHHWPLRTNDINRIKENEIYISKMNTISDAELERLKPVKPEVKAFKEMTNAEKMRFC